MDEVPVRITPDGIEILAADPAMVAMIDLTFPSSMFDPYTVEGEDNITFMINADDLKTVVSDARKVDTLTLSVTQQHGTYTLHSAVERDDETLLDGVETLDYDPSERPSTSELEYSGEVTVALDPLLDAIVSMNESFQLGVDADRLVLWSETDARGTVDEFRAGGDHVQEITVKDGPVASLYSRDYLETLQKLQHSIDTVEVRTGTDFPLEVAVVDDRFDLSFTVAPRIDEDDTITTNLRSVQIFDTDQQLDDRSEPDVYAIVDESYQNPVEMWFKSDDAEYRIDRGDARERAAELDRKHVPVSVYAVTARPLGGDGQ